MEKRKIYPLTTTKIAEAHFKDQEMKVYFKKNAPTQFILLKTQK
jgi:hypothetical protein